MVKVRSVARNLLQENDNGFTILEMLVAIVVIGVLSAVSVTTFVGFRKDAIHATLIEDVWHAGTKVQRIIILSDDPGEVPSEEEVDFFVSNENNKLSIKVIANPKGSYCVIGSNDQYEDITIYYSSEQGGITTDETICGEPVDESNDNIDTTPDGPVAQPAPEPTYENTGNTGYTTTDTTDGNTNPNGEPIDNPTDTPTSEPTDTPTTEPTDGTNGGLTGEPTDNPTDEPTNTNTSPEPTNTTSPEPTTTSTAPPPPTMLAFSNNYPEYGPGMATVIPTSAIPAIEMNIPSETCRGLLNEKIKAKSNLYGKMKYYNLVSIMARLQSSNHTLEDILKTTPEGVRVIEINKQIALNKKCSDYVNSKATVTKYYAEAYNAEQAAYHEFLWNLDENSANTEAYVHAYKLLYERVYKLNQ